MIFISYSHKDEREKEKLLAHLGVLQQEGLVGLWSDDRIGAGADWREEISEAIAQASVAILLISANFLTSNFILREEVPELLERREGEGLTVFPVIIRDCAWQEVGWLAKMNVRPKNGRAIWGAGTRRVDAELAAIAKEVAAVVKADTPTAMDNYGTSESARNTGSGQRRSRPSTNIQGRSQSAEEVRMTVFDQRGQHVTSQYNAAGDINFGAVQNRLEVVAHLEKLQAELRQAIEAGVFEEETAIDAEYQLKKAVQQAKKPEPDKRSLLEYLNEAKALIEGVTAAAGLVGGLAQAAALVKQLF